MIHLFEMNVMVNSERSIGKNQVKIQSGEMWNIPVVLMSQEERGFLLWKSVSEMLAFTKVWTMATGVEEIKLLMTKQAILCFSIDIYKAKSEWNEIAE